MSKPTITVYGAYWCPDCRRSKQFLGEHQIPYAWVDIEQDPEAERFVIEKNAGKRIIPTLVFADGTVLVEPSNAQLATKLGLRTTASRSHYPLVVIGGGPAGLTTALYTAREAIDTLVIERAAFGGQAAATEKLDNLPGFPESIPGIDFANRLRQQAERFGVELLQAQDVVRVHSHDNYHTCDGPFYKGKQVAVIGGGNSAAEESLLLTKFADHVTLLVRGDTFKASPVIQESVLNDPKIDVRFNTEVKEFLGAKAKLNKLRLYNNQRGEASELIVDGAFVFIGLDPNTGFLQETPVRRDRWGFLITGHDLVHDGNRPPGYEQRDPTYLETSVPGIFAAGDVRLGSTKQVASAAGEGATAALLIREYLKTV
ncbi:MAG: FAD-dependent oxidoreductase [Caldilineaceae bacterium]